MIPDVLYRVTVAGSAPVWAELVQEIGQDETMRVHLGALTWDLSTDLAEDLADALIGAVADRAAPVTVPGPWTG